MSIDRCHDCSTLVDTDDEPEAYIEIGNMRRMTWTICVCRPCRERREDQDEREADQANVDTGSAS